jgi:hypothetical protein
MAGLMWVDQKRTVMMTHCGRRLMRNPNGIDEQGFQKLYI